MSDTTATVGQDSPKPTIQGVPPHFKGTAILRFKKPIFKSSKTQNPMIETDLEIILPSTVESPFDGKNYALDARDLKMWLLLWNKDKNGNLLQNGLHWLNESLLPMLGLPVFKLNDSNPLADSPLYNEEKNPEGVKLDGLCVECIIESEENIEQRRLPNGTYEPLKDMKGNVIKKGWRWKTPSPADIIRLADEQVPASNNPY